MSVPIRFALVGKSGSGKSSAGVHLSRLIGVEHIRTGAICRQIARMLFGNDDKCSTQTLDDALTSIDPSIFVRAALRPYGNDQGFVLDALRFQEDAVLARALGCRIIRIVALPELRHVRLHQRGQSFDPATDGLHRSETELDTFEVDYQITNDGDMSSLEAALVEVAARS